MPPLMLAVGRTARLVTSDRKLWLPFMIAAFVEVLFIALLWLAPHPPFSKVLAPPIRFFFSDRVLHYPWHLWFLYHSMKHTHLVASLLIGAFMSGIACAMVRQLHEGKPLSLREALIKERIPYGKLLWLWGLIWALAKATTVLLTRIAPTPIGGFWGSLSAVIVLQALFVYAIPAAVFTRVRWWHALGMSVQETLRHPFSTFIVVSLSSALLIAYAVLISPSMAAQWMMKISPEFLLLCVAGRLIVWTVADAIMTVTVAHLWWLHRKPFKTSEKIPPSGVSIEPVEGPHVIA